MIAWLQAFKWTHTHNMEYTENLNTSAIYCTYGTGETEFDNIVSA